MDFVPKKFHGIDSEQFSLFRGRKCSFRGLRKSQLRCSEWNGITWRKFVLKNSHNNFTIWFVFTLKVVFSDTTFGTYGCRILPFESAEFREFASVFVPRYGIPSIFIFEIVRKFWEFSVPRNSRNSIGILSSISSFVYSVATVTVRMVCTIEWLWAMSWPDSVRWRECVGVGVGGQ